MRRPEECPGDVASASIPIGTKLTGLYWPGSPIGASPAAVYRHQQDHLPATLIQAQEAEDAARADSLMDQLQAVMARVQKLFDACDGWLSDPEDPSRYEIGPRAEDIQVVYSEEGPDGKKVRHKEKLSSLLAQAGQGRRGFEVVEVKHADPRELILKTANTLRASLEMMLKVTEVKDLEARLDELEKTLGGGETWASKSGLRGLKGGGSSK